MGQSHIVDSNDPICKHALAHADHRPANAIVPVDSAVVDPPVPYSLLSYPPPSERSPGLLVIPSAVQFNFPGPPTICYSKHVRASDQRACLQFRSLFVIKFSRLI